MFPEEQLTSAKVAGFVSPSRDLLTPKEIEREICFSVNHPGSELRLGPLTAKPTLDVFNRGCQVPVYLIKRAPARPNPIERVVRKDGTRPGFPIEVAHRVRVDHPRPPCGPRGARPRDGMR